MERAKSQMNYAKIAMDKYNTQMRYAVRADEKAVRYLRMASDFLKK